MGRRNNRDRASDKADVRRREREIEKLRRELIKPKRKPYEHSNKKHY